MKTVSPAFTISVASPVQLPFTIQRTGVSYANLTEAHEAAIDNDVIKVAAPADGSAYVLPANGLGVPHCVATIWKQNLTVEWAVPGVPVKFDLSAWAAASNGVTCIEVHPSCTSLTLRGLDVTGSQRPYTWYQTFLDIESGYPYQGYPNDTPYTITVEYCAARKWTNGIIGGHNTRGTLNLRYSLIENCMAGEGQSHGVYMAAIEHFNVLGCTFRTTPGGVGGDYGHLFKSRAKHCSVIASVFDGAGGCSRPLDISNGGDFTMLGCFAHKYDDGTSGQVIRFGPEQRYDPSQPQLFQVDGRDELHSVFIAQSTLQNDRSDSLLLIDAIVKSDLVTPAAIPQTVRNNVAVGSASADITKYANNVAVTTSQIGPTGALTIASIAGTQNDATTEYAGLFTVPMARSDSNKGAHR